MLSIFGVPGSNPDHTAELEGVAQRLVVGIHPELVTLQAGDLRAQLDFQQRALALGLDVGDCGPLQHLEGLVRATAPQLTLQPDIPRCQAVQVGLHP